MDIIRTFIIERLAGPSTVRRQHRYAGHLAA
jgi:hypothetical protein